MTFLGLYVVAESAVDGLGPPVLEVVGGRNAYKGRTVVACCMLPRSFVGGCIVMSGCIEVVVEMVCIRRWVGGWQSGLAGGWDGCGWVGGCGLVLVARWRSGLMSKRRDGLMSR